MKTVSITLPYTRTPPLLQGLCCRRPFMPPVVGGLGRDMWSSILERKLGGNLSLGWSCITTLLVERFVRTRSRLGTWHMWIIGFDIWTSFFIRESQAEDMCSRYTTALNGTFPSVREYEIPAFKADMGTVRNGTSTPYFTPALTPKDSVYAVWIGIFSPPIPNFQSQSHCLNRVCQHQLTHLP